MSDSSRRNFLLGLALPLTLSACTNAPESEQVAKKFVDYYYAKINLDEAKKLSVGLAEEKINHQLGLVEGAPPSANANVPAVDYRLLTRENPTSGEATYIFEVKPQVSDVGQRKVFVKLREENGQWRVTQFSEGEQRVH